MFTIFVLLSLIYFLAFHFDKVFQMHMLRLHYLNLENFLEWICYVTSLLLVIDFTECAADTGLRQVRLNPNFVNTSLELSLGYSTSGFQPSKRYLLKPGSEFL